jgi:6,7-dimethyl-8-ribityllumazine synthase
MLRKQFLKKGPVRDASKLSIGIVVAEFNSDITEGLLAGALETLREWNVSEKKTHVYRVYGSFDLTQAAARMLRKHKPDAVIALGCIVKGETDHDKHIASAVFNGLTALASAEDRPVSLGVLTTNTLAQARVRSRGATNHGAKAAVAALQAAMLH